MRERGWEGHVAAGSERASSARPESRHVSTKNPSYPPLHANKQMMHVSNHSLDIPDWDAYWDFEVSLEGRERSGEM